MIRGYTVMDNTLVIHRLGWSYRLDTSSMKDVFAKPLARSDSRRLFGTGNVFGYYDWFHHKELGDYRAWVTDPARRVVLRLIRY